MRSNLTDKFFTLSLDLLCIVGTDATFKKVNPALVRALEYSEAELTAKPIFDFIHPEDIPATQIEFEKLLAGTAVINFENRFRTKNGQYLTSSWTASIDQETGNIFAIGRDLTEQKKNQHKMSQLNATLNSHWMVSRTDTDGTILDVQGKFCELSGYTKEELVGKTHRVLNSGVHSKKFFEQMWTTLTSGKTWKGTLENRKKNGEHYFVETVITPILDTQNKITEYISIRFDVTEQKLLELKQKNTSKRLNDAEIISKLGFWELDLITQRGYWSQGQLALFGLESTDQAPTFELFMSFVHPEDQTTLREKFSEILENKQLTFELDFRILIDNGKTVRWLKERGTLELNKEGQPIRISGSVQDRTQEKLAEIELKKTLATLEATSRLLEQTSKLAKIGGWELDLSTGRVTMSEETLRIHEIDKDYVPPLYSTGSNWYPPEAWPTVQAAVQAAMTQGKPYDLESPFVTAKGQNIWVRVQGFPVTVAGQVTQLQGTMQDITDRKHKELESKFIGDSMGFGIWKLDPQTGTLEWDERMYALYEMNPSDFSGAYAAWESALTPEAKQSAVKELELALSGEKEFNTEFEITLKNGKVRHIAARGIVIRNSENKPLKMYGLNWDVTKRVLADLELKAANARLLQSSRLAALGEMSAGIAHEINNPLGIIAGTIRNLASFKDNPEKFASKIENIRKSCDRMAKIVSGLKKFSRSNQTKALQRHRILDIAKETATLTDIKSKKMNTPVTIEGSTQAQILCDDIEIEQVLVNLINNGIDAVQERPEKWVKVSILEDSDSVVIQITDSGPGIPENIRKKMFDAFFTTKPTHEGTGLGLSIAKGILDEHQGTITIVENCPNTCFEIRLPIAAALKKVV